MTYVGGIMDAPTRVLKTINHEEPDRIPAFESAFTNNSIMAHYGVPPGGGLVEGLQAIKNIPNKDQIVRMFLKSREQVAKGLEPSFEFFRRVKLDIGLSVVSLFPRKLTEDGFVDEYGRIMKPEKVAADGTITLNYYGGYFQSFQEYENFEQPDPADEIRLVGFLAGLEVQKKMQDEIFAVPSTGALMECTWEGFGIERFSRLLTNQKQVRRVFDDRGKFTLELVKILAEKDAKMVLLWDDYGYKNGLFMSPRNYRTYVFPWIRQICQAAHKHDCKIMLHSDGDLLQIFQDIVDCGVDALNPIEPTTANPEYDVFKLHERYGDKITFVGNISPMMLTTGSIPDIESYCKKLIRELAPGGGYIFSSGHSINPAVTLDRWQAVLRIREKFGNYPINVPLR
jgi:uroporphyrinogen decarboxylase